MNKLILTVLVVVGAVAAIGMSTLAVFTSTGTDGGNTVTAGVASISLASNPVFLPADFPNGYAPGDINEGEIVVSNDGSLDIRYAVTRHSTPEISGPGSPDFIEIASLMKLRIGLQVGSCDYPYHNTDGSDKLNVSSVPNSFTDSGDDIELFSGILHTVGAQSPGVLDAGIPSGAGAGELITFGDPAQGLDNGDRILAQSTNEVLCWSVVLPSGVGNPQQGDSTTASFGFYAEQTANNP